MTRIRAAHTFHETVVHTPDTACGKCGKQTIHVCEWCGACMQCHTGPGAEPRF